MMVRAIWNQYRTAFSGLSREIWVLAFAIFVNRCGSMVLAFMTLYLTSQHGMRESVAGKLLSVYGLGSILGNYLGGRLIRHVGAIRVQTIGMFLSVPFYLIFPLWSTWWPLAINLFLLSAVSQAIRPANATAVTYFSPPEERPRAFGLLRLASNLGFSFGPAIGGVLATINYHLLFWVDGATTLACALLLLFFFRMRVLEQETQHASKPRDRTSPLSDRPFVFFLLLLLLADLVFFQFGSTYPLYLRDHFGLSKPQIGGMFAVNTITIVVFEMLLIHRVKNGPLMRLIGWGALLSCLGFGVLPFGVSGLYCVACMLLVTTGEMLMFPLSTAYASDRAEKVAGEGGTPAYMTWYTMVGCIAAVLGPGIGAIIYEQNPDWLWGIACIVGVIVLGGFLLLDRMLVEVEEQPRGDAK